MAERTPDTIADALRYYGERMGLRKRLESAMSLDQPKDQDVGDIAADIALGFTPLQYPQAARDFERARRESDPIGMGLASLAAIPVVGGVSKAAGRLRKMEDVVAARKAAMEAAQINAAKPVAEGGLGLHAANTPMERAQAMGFESGWAHGSPKNDIEQLKPSDFGAEGPGAYATNYLPEASTYAHSAEGATIYPLMVKKSEALITNAENPYNVLSAETDQELLEKLNKLNKTAIIKTQEKTPKWLINAGASAMPERQHYVSIKPENFRSQFAAFDPAKINSPDLLAGMAGPTVLAAALMEQQRREKERKEAGL